ncbi:MAG: phosphoribosylglycinamide formyltransferase [Tissierellia bacterium]|nr:phosphoribosylglycinamide formyltransferase [Tissierellia bacterium]
MLKIGVLISGGGTNLQAIIDNIERGCIKGKIQLVISNKKAAYGLERARKAGIEALYINPKDYKDSQEYNQRLIEELKARGVELVVLAGYLKILSKDFIQAFRNRIINIHPSLIPSFCGPGYYGERVHKAVLDYGCRVSGATVHIVDEGTDTGPIVLQKCVEVDQDETVESLQKKVLKVEHEILVEAVKLFCEGRIFISGRQVKIL